MTNHDGVLDLLAAHRTVRDFEDRPVPDEDIARAVRAAQQTATSSWIQAYGLIQVTDPDERARLVELTGGQPQVARAGAFFVVCGDVRRHRLVAEDAGAEYASNLETFLLPVVDASLFAQSLVLAFEALGYGTCYVGGLRNDLPEVDRLLDLPHGVLPLFGLCVGIPASDPGRRPRLPVEAVWVRDRYPRDEQVRAAVAAQDEQAASYYNARGAPGRTWSGGLWRKFARPSRESLLAYYRSKGARFE